ncbi:MAG: NAD(P)H-hydrate dehydratase [Chloroflexota bacterium]|nr:NAD(P)H-hydrate dehydratase [Chloroflexota bacterium]
MKLVNTQEMRHLDQAANASGVPYAQMMENAGRAVALKCQEALDVVDRPILVLVGPGHNGGDGLVAARYLAQADAEVTCYIWKRDVEEDANFARVEELGLSVIWAEEDEGWEELRQRAGEAEMTIDALLGTGVDRPIGGSLRELLEVVGGIVRQRKEGERGQLITPSFPFISLRSSLSPLIVAVDVPSGVNCDTGAVDPVTLPADLTVTFGCPKVGQFRFPAAEVLGQLTVADIGIPPEFLKPSELELATGETIRGLLPQRPLDAHKGTFGKALLVVGSVNYTGAAYLAGASATRVGTGLVTLALAEPLHSVVSSKLTEATYLILSHELGVIGPGAVKVLAEEMEDYDALLLGPGLTQEEPTVEFVRRFLGLQSAGRPGRIGFRAAEEPEEQLSLPPLVIDADGLNILAKTEDWSARLPQGTILTPHPGELSRLTDLSIDEINERRIETARECAREWNQVVVLKGAFTVVASPDGRTIVQPFANPGLASAGTGDVLAGSIVGLRAQGLEPFEAAVAGAYLHGLAGQLAREELGETGMVAGDLIPRLPLAIRWLRQGQWDGE